MHAKAPITFLDKFRSLPGLLTDASLVVPEIVRTTISFYKKHRRSPTNRELHHLVVPIIRKTRLFRRLDADFERNVGRIVITWAIIEHSVDLINAISVKRAGGQSLTRRIPQALKPKLALFKRAFEELEPLAPFRERGLLIHGRLLAIKELRNDFSHGIVSDRYLLAKRVLRNSYGVGKLVPHYRTYSGVEVLGLLFQMEHLGEDIQDLLAEIDTAVPFNEINDTNR